MVGTQLLGVRAAILARFAPLSSSVRGRRRRWFTQRAIRRACGGRESASLYHRAKYLQLAVLGLGGCSPALAGRCGGAVRGAGRAADREFGLQWAYYKKNM